MPLATTIQNADGSLEKQFHLHPGQIRVMESHARFTAMIAGTGSGKTSFGPVWCSVQIVKAQANPKNHGRGMVIGPTYDLLRREARAAIVATFQGTEFEGILHEQQNVYHLPNGYDIYLRSADKWESIEGGQWDWIWWDEAGQSKYAVWLAVQARLAMSMGPCLITTTPYPKGSWLKREIYDRWKAGDPDYLVVNFTSIENPEYPVDEYERMRIELPPEVFGMRYGGKFTHLQGLVYPELMDAVIDTMALPEGWQQWRKIGAIDFGYHNPFVILNAVESPDGVLYLYEEHYKSGMLLAEHAKRLRPGTLYFADPSAKQDIEELRAIVAKDTRTFNGVRIRPADNEVAVGIERVRTRLRTRRLLIARACKFTIDEGESYHYRDAEDKLGADNAPEKVDDHAMDALRYLVAGVDAVKARPRLTVISA